MNGELSVVVAPRTFCLELTTGAGELPRIQSVHMSPELCTVCAGLAIRRPGRIVEQRGVHSGKVPRKLGAGDEVVVALTIMSVCILNEDGQFRGSGAATEKLKARATGAG